MTNIMIFILVGVVALLTILCCCLYYALSSRDERLDRLSVENRDLKDVIEDMESDVEGLPPAPIPEQSSPARTCSLAPARTRSLSPEREGSG